LQRVIFLVCVLALGSCRSRDAVCGASGCEAVEGAGGQAGNGDEFGAGAGGDGDEIGGAGGVAGMAGDSGGNSAGGAHVASGAGGDEAAGAAGSEGGERHDAGTSGMPTSACGSCAPGLTCVERETGGASCEYPNPGRWLVFQSNDTGEFPIELHALRLDGANHSAPISLSAGIPADYFDVDSWSPDGRHLLAFGMTLDENNEINYLLHAEFGNGLPVVQPALPGLPLDGFSMYSRAWASDSSRVLIQNEGKTPETYLARFTSDGVRSELLFRGAETSQLAFCSDPRWFIREIVGATGRNETRLVDSENPEGERAIWPGTTHVSPDGRFLIGSDSETGTWGARCEADAKAVHLSDRSPDSFEPPRWSADSRFVAIFHGDGESGEVDVRDALNDFQAVFHAYASEQQYHWSAHGSRLVVFGTSEPGAACEIIDADLAAMPLQVARRGSCPTLAWGTSWGVLEDGAIWSPQETPEGPYGIWLLDQGADAWRQVATWEGNEPHFAPDGSVVVVYSEGDISAFPLNGPLVEMPLEPKLPHPGHVQALYGGGAILHYSQWSPMLGKLWWAPLGPSSFGPAVPLTDVAYVDLPSLQPRP
jgi:hypothetical protein